MTFIAIPLIIIGIVFIAISALGVLRLPDFYSRAHALGILDTVGAGFIFIGLAIFYGFSLVSAKLIFLLIFLLIANPTITHVFMRAAMKCGIKPWGQDTAEENNTP